MATPAPNNSGARGSVPDADAWHSVDPLGEALHLLRMNSVFYTRSEFLAPWGLVLPPMPDCLMFHMVTQGRCMLVIDGVAHGELEPGDFALLPHGEGHRIGDHIATPAHNLFDLPREVLSERYEILRHGGGGREAPEPTTMICGAVRFDHPAASQLVKLLPGLLTVKLRDSPRQNWIHSLLQLMAAEAAELKPGGETVITRLADVLVVYAIRNWIADNEGARSGWLGALQDRQIGRALLQIHRDPGRAWTLAEMAVEAAMSRSAFAARFKELLDIAPMNYLTRWRLQIAAGWLREEGLTVSVVAGRLGYESEAAFSRAFKRLFGVPPGSMRRDGNAR